MNNRIKILKQKMLNEDRYVSIEQALIITKSYKDNPDKSVIIKRAIALKNSMLQLEIGIQDEELIVGNRTKGVRNGVVFPESGSSWIDKEIETLSTRAQDKFNVSPENIEIFKTEIKPFWAGKSLEDVIRHRYGDEIDEIAKVVKINQKDHAQGHICPNCERWLELGPAGILEQVKAAKLKTNDTQKLEYFDAQIIVLEGAIEFIKRYSVLALERSLSLNDSKQKADLERVSKVCANLAVRGANSFYETIQSIWFLFVLLHMESNASSFSPGRMDQFLYKYYLNDINSGKLTDKSALELLECLWLKFNQIVYLRNSHSAKYFAGFPIGFNIAIGGIDKKGDDCTNELSYLMLKAQEELLLPQPNLSVRLHEKTPSEFLKQAIRVVAKGGGMPQFFNDKSIIPSLKGIGISPEDANNYAIVGCVEFTTPGNSLGWSDAAMFNLNKALELTLNGGKCLLTGDRMIAQNEDLLDFDSYEMLENQFAKNIDYFIDKMICACEVVEQAHIEILPSPFLSSVIDGCLDKGQDVTAGGAKYNFSGIQMIQVANLADSLAAIKQMVYDKKVIGRQDLLNALRNNFKDSEVMRTALLHKAPKYGNDIEWVDDTGAKWAEYFRNRLSGYTNYRGGKYHTGMYTVSAHVPMGENVGASPDGRFAKTPLADGGLSPVYGRDVNGPTAVLKSVSRIKNNLTSNGGLLNMKFMPSFFKTEEGIEKFAMFLRTFVDLEIPHIQFNILNQQDMIKAQKEPEKYRNLTVRVAGYTAYFTELAYELQNEIIERTNYGEV